MNSLISVNNKFMEVNPKRLVELILESKYTKGVEIYINAEDELHVKYLDNLVYEISKNNLVLQIHSDINLDINKQINYMKKLETYYDYLNKPIIVTLHTVYNDNKNISLNDTVNYLSTLLNNINNNKIIICLENLNDEKDLNRLNKEDIKNTILNDEKLYFTYDIGHDMADYGDITNLDKYIIDDIRNVHIHTNENGFDHLPIYKDSSRYLDVLKALTFLKVNHYKYNIVFEYDLFSCKGDNIEEKIKDYLNSIDFVSEKYN